MSADDNRQLGRITAARLEREDHGCLTVWLTFDFGGSGQGFGGFVLDTYDKAKSRRVGTAGGLDLVLQLLALFDVDHLGAIVGRVAYAIREDGWGGTIVGIETPPFDGGRRFMVADWRAEWFPKAVHS